MAKRSANGGSWLIVGAIVLILVVPKEVWIAIGVMLAIAGAVYAANKFFGAKAKPVQPEIQHAPEPSAYEPTLAELMAISQQQPSRSRRAAVEAQSTTRAPSGSIGSHTTGGVLIPENQEDKNARRHDALEARPTSWENDRDALAQTNRERSSSLREKFSAHEEGTRPVAIAAATVAPVDEHFNHAATEAPGPAYDSEPERHSILTARAAENAGERSASVWENERDALAQTNDERSGSLKEMLSPHEEGERPGAVAAATAIPVNEQFNHADAGAQAVEKALADGRPQSWQSDRQAVIQSNRERANYLREKYPSPPGPGVSLDPTTDGPTPHARWPNSEPERHSILAARAAENVGERSAAVDQPPPASSLAPHSPSPNPSIVDRALGNFMRAIRGEPQEERFFSANLAEPQRASPSHVLPPAPAGLTKTRWVKPEEAVEIAGLTVPGGMLYVGPYLTTHNGDDEPALINPRLRVAAQGDYRIQHTNYWPTYADITPQARRAYLQWLAEGRSHPACDIGLVFLFFYGLERRIIVDSRNDEDARAEWPAILAEIRRLLRIYGDRSGSFKRYAGELLSWMELDGASSKLYEKPVPDFPRTYELPPYLRLALGQASVDRQPLPPALALAWVQLSPEIRLRSAATRCPEEFAQLFIQRYQETFGAGLVLPKNRTKLKFVYQPASSGLRGAKVTMNFGDVPDVTALTAPIKKLGEIALQCNAELGAYSRMVGKDPTAASGLEAALLLPASLWPEGMRSRLQSLTARMRDGRVSLPLGELLASLGGMKPPINRERVRSLARALEGADIGLEPHVQAGARVPGERDTVVLFAQSVMDSEVGSGAEYQTAALTLQLASAMANSDGDFNDQEVAHLRAEIEGWAHLTPAERRRLQAHLQWLTTSPPTLAGMKKKLEPLPAAARETLAAFMATLAQSDGLVSPDEVKFLEKVYKALGVETKRVFSDVHALGAGSTPVSVRQAEKEGFRLDADRLAALQADTAKVSALLSSIFTEEAPASPEPTQPVAAEPEAEPETSSPLNLDEAHAALVRLLLSRAEWSRAELEDAAADLDIMLDGALEQINEAAFDAFDEPLCEGDDPLTVNIDLLEKLEA